VPGFTAGDELLARANLALAPADQPDKDFLSLQDLALGRDDVIEQRVLTGHQRVLLLQPEHNFMAVALKGQPSWSSVNSVCHPGTLPQRD
jgi:hypothetical protein